MNCYPMYKLLKESNNKKKFNTDRMKQIRKRNKNTNYQKNIQTS